MVGCICVDVNVSFFLKDDSIMFMCFFMVVVFIFLLKNEGWMVISSVCGRFLCRLCIIVIYVFSFLCIG